MTIYLMAKTKVAIATLAAFASVTLLSAASAQDLPVTTAQKATANAVASDAAAAAGRADGE